MFKAWYQTKEHVAVKDATTSISRHGPIKFINLKIYLIDKGFRIL